MLKLQLIGITLITLVLPAVSGLRCIACTSDPSDPNWSCIGNSTTEEGGIMYGTIPVENREDRECQVKCMFVGEQESMYSG